MVKAQGNKKVVGYGAMHFSAGAKTVTTFEQWRKELEPILEFVEKEAGFNISEKSRVRESVYYRAIYYKLARELTTLSLAKIGNVCGKRDHATVLYALSNTFDEVKNYRKDIYYVYQKVMGEIDEESYPMAEIYRLKKEVKSLNKTIENIKYEIKKEYFSNKDQMLAIQKATYNNTVE
jgi:hypothetical protein